MAPGAGAGPWTTAPGLDGPGAVQWPMANLAVMDRPTNAGLLVSMGGVGRTGIARWGDACVLWKGRQTCCYGGADSAAWRSCHVIRCVRISHRMEWFEEGISRRSLLFSACFSMIMVPCYYGIRSAAFRSHGGSMIAWACRELSCMLLPS